MVEKSTVDENMKASVTEGQAMPATHEDDEFMLGKFSDNVSVLETLLKLILQELEASNPSDLRIQVYFNDIVSVQNELSTQQALAVSARGRGDADVIKLQNILKSDIPELHSRLQSRVKQLEEHKRSIDAKYTEEKAKLEDELRAITARLPPPPPIDSGSSKGDDDEMNARISKLESDVAAIQIDVAVIRSNYASKEDIAGVRTQLTEARLIFATKEEIHREMNLQTWKLIGVAAALVAAVYFLARPIPSTTFPPTGTQMQSVQPAAAPPASAK